MNTSKTNALDELIKHVPITDEITEDVIGYAKQELASLRLEKEQADVVIERQNCEIRSLEMGLRMIQSRKEINMLANKELNERLKEVVNEAKLVIEMCTKAGRFDNGDRKCCGCGSWEYETHAEDCDINNWLIKYGEEQK